MSVPQDVCLAIHQRLLAGDETASADLFLLLWEPVIRTICTTRRVSKKNGLVGDAATSAFADYIKRPGIYDPGKSALLTFLVNAATGDYRNLREKDRRRREHEFSGGTRSNESDSQRMDRLQVGSAVRAGKKRYGGRNAPKRRAE